MVEWRAGLQFPLPVDIDPATGIGTVNTDIIRLLAASFDPAWAPALDQRATATVAPPAASMQADVAAFLAATTTSLARGIGLGVRAITNAQAALPFIREAFNQLGANGFEVALAMTDELVNCDIGVLAAQRDGAAIITVVRTALAAPPAGITADQQASLTRANAMIARVAGVAAAAAPAAAPTRAEKVVTIDTVKLVGSTFTPSTQVAVANAIYAQCNVRFSQGVDATATAAQTIAAPAPAGPGPAPAPRRAGSAGLARMERLRHRRAADRHRQRSARFIPAPRPRSGFRRECGRFLCSR